MMSQSTLGEMKNGEDTQEEGGRSSLTRLKKYLLKMFQNVWSYFDVIKIRFSFEPQLPGTLQES